MPAERLASLVQGHPGACALGAAGVSERAADCRLRAQIDKSQEGTGDNHAISALKFKIILEFLEAGWSVLLSDVDIVVIQVGLEACQQELHNL